MGGRQPTWHGKVVGALPLFHVFGMTGVMNVAIAGGFEIILLPRFRLDQLLKVIAKERATVLLGVPTMYSAINGSQLINTICPACAFASPAAPCRAQCRTRSSG